MNRARHGQLHTTDKTTVIRPTGALTQHARGLVPNAVILLFTLERRRQWLFSKDTTIDIDQKIGCLVAARTKITHPDRTTTHRIGVPDLQPDRAFMRSIFKHRLIEFSTHHVSIQQRLFDKRLFTHFNGNRE